MYDALARRYGGMPSQYARLSAADFVVCMSALRAGMAADERAREGLSMVFPVVQVG